MKIKASKRVVYRFNPLVEVIGQMRFSTILEMEKSPPDRLQKKLLAKYPKLSIEAQNSAVVAPANMIESPLSFTRPREVKIYHFSSEDDVWRISVCSEFFTLTCTKYENWGIFRKKFLDEWKAFSSIYSIRSAQRLGLRYRNVIERTKLNLANISWSELIQSPVVGMFSSGNLSSSGKVKEEDILSSIAQTQINLDTCKLLLQTALVRNRQQTETAFLIDGDYYVDSLTVTDSALKKNLEALHANAGAVFRGCITSRLHTALRPRSG